MLAYVAIPFTCWLCALRVIPRKPRLGNEVEELVYTRLLGRQHQLMFFAAIMTAASVLVLIVTLPQRIDPTVGEIRRVNQYCAAVSADVPFCYRLESDGSWLKAARQSDGQWVVIGAVSAPSMESAPMISPQP